MQLPVLMVDHIDILTYWAGCQMSHLFVSSNLGMHSSSLGRVIGVTIIITNTKPKKKLSSQGLSRQCGKSYLYPHWVKCDKDHAQKIYEKGLKSFCTKNKNGEGIFFVMERLDRRQRGSGEEDLTGCLRTWQLPYANTNLISFWNRTKVYKHKMTRTEVVILKMLSYLFRFHQWAHWSNRNR